MGDAARLAVVRQAVDSVVSIVREFAPNGTAYDNIMMDVLAALRKAPGGASAATVGGAQQRPVQQADPQRSGQQAAPQRSVKQAILPPFVAPPPVYNQMLIKLPILDKVCGLRASVNDADSYARFAVRVFREHQDALFAECAAIEKEDRLMARIGRFIYAILETSSDVTNSNDEQALRKLRDSIYMYDDGERMLLKVHGLITDMTALYRRLTDKTALYIMTKG